MKKLLVILLVLVFTGCNLYKGDKLTCYAWLSHDDQLLDKELKEKFIELKKNGIDAILYSAGHQSEPYQKAGKMAEKAGLGFHAWIPTMIQRPGDSIQNDWYAVNGLGESAIDKPAYVKYYTFLCPNRESVYRYLEKLYVKIALLPEVDGIHLDYIRFPDVILARGLWEKYNLVMDKEYPQFDYCYCDSCVADFKITTGIDIRQTENPSSIDEWKQFRYNLITSLVNRLSTKIHSLNKQLTAAVFPGPNSIAKQIVRQEWQKWNIDAFFPMNYNDFYLKDTRWIGEVCAESKNALNGAKPFYSGLFISPTPTRSSNPDPENHGLLPEELADAIKQSMENGSSGICLFTPDRMTKEHWKIFRKSIYKNTQ